MHEPVAHARFVDVAGFGVGNPEGVVAAVVVRTFRKVAMKIENVVHETSAKFLHVLFLAFAAQEFLPRQKQILDRDDILVAMRK